jgi:hypothetical protein
MYMPEAPEPAEDIVFWNTVWPVPPSQMPQPFEVMSLEYMLSPLPSASMPLGKGTILADVVMVLYARVLELAADGA